tara:strand:- start:123 stop:836 length:714 start_codon:yes stop_codon:yes gene_type:complete
MRSKLGIESYGIFWAVLELLFNEENKLCIDDYDALAFSLQCDSAKLKQVIEDFDLFVVEDNCFYSKRLNEHIEEINLKSKKAKESVSKRWNNTNVIRTKNDSSTSISKSNSKSNSKSINKSKIDDRVNAFKNAVHNLDFMNKEDKEDFYLYWSELTKSQTNPRMRWETERTWSLNLRAKRWINNGFNKQKSRFPDHYDSLLMKRLDVSAQKEYEQHLKNLGYVTEYNPNAGAKWVKR